MSFFEPFMCPITQNTPQTYTSTYTAPSKLGTGTKHQPSQQQVTVQKSKFSPELLIQIKKYLEMKLNSE
jgi:hypothetical protein